MSVSEPAKGVLWRIPISLNNKTQKEGFSKTPPLLGPQFLHLSSKELIIPNDFWIPDGKFYEAVV